MQGNFSVLATIAVGIIIIGAVAYGIYSTNSGLSVLSEQNTSMKGQIASLNQQISSVNQQVSTINEQDASLSIQNSDLGRLVNASLGELNQQLSGLEQQVSVLEQRTLSVVTMTNTVVSIQTMSVTTTSTVTSISAVPQAALVIVADSYNSTTKTFTFQVHNNENYTIYAQVSATLVGGYNGYPCYSNVVGSFISQVSAFDAGTTTPTSLNLALGSYTGCGSSPLTGLTMSLIVPPSTSVSPTYTFNVVPGYPVP